MDVFFCLRNLSVQNGVYIIGKEIKMGPNRLFLVFLLMSFVTFASSQGWCPLNNFPGVGLRSGSGFTLGSKGYQLFGTNGFSNSNQLWEYNLASDSWNRKKDYPGPGRRSGIVFSIGLEAFAGLGWEGSRVFQDFCKYNQFSNTWLKIDSFPSQATVGTMSTSFSGKGYVVGGATDNNLVANQLYEYNPIADSWTLLSNSLPIGQRMEGIMEVVNNEIYVGFGHDFLTTYDDLWRFTPLGNTWTQVASLPGPPRLNPISFVVEGKLIVGGGYQLNSGNQHNDYYAYDPISNNWSRIMGYSTSRRSRVSAFVIADSAYTIGGWTGNNSSEVWRYAPFEFTRTDTVLCEGASLVLDVRSSGSRYLWQDSSRRNSYLVEQAGVYWVNISKVNGCIRRDSFIVSLVQFPQVELGNDTSFCTKNPFTLSAFNAGATYLWQDSSTSPSFTVRNSGLYKVEVSNENCTAIDSIEVIFYEPPIINLGSDRSVCFGETLLLDAFNSGQTTYEWQDGSTSSSFLVSTPGTYTVKATRDGCETIKSVRIDYVARPMFDLGNDTLLCEGNTLELVVNEPGAAYKWQDGSVNNKFMVKGKGLYWVELSLNGCLSRDSIFVDYELLPRVDFGMDRTVCFGDAFFLDAYEPNTLNYLWQDGSTSARYIITESGTFHVLASNRCGADSDRVNIILKDCYCSFYVPNVFSPNGDGNNDLFGPVYKCDLTNYQLFIYNRWGELLYQTDDVNSPWNGQGSNGPLPIGTYVYTIQYQPSGTSRFEQLKGTISIVN